ncbi:MAG: cytochrome b/b6 domain-containing protein [Gemmatimonadetes bacterium]|nr:cytochrome b/b6 domain-containing protein [Gemmatimonadota bacterium]MXV94580.1 cytochrome b/b6 domain-containing protein [Gemmatimonadota bacterium]MYB05758.1 cytochrome b/b6 domain-containing protein [Gemmatimonadota bacterium]MYE15612.1 cytochrome b/b6 domain-containing protein [Gemmatimonadota bacterium]MYG23485.1 cytochrome b/b6 domain-containing protein [Gemmatimonadota bacterium]
MEFLRRALNPWGEDVPIGVSWDLIWAAVIIGAVFVVVHALMVPKKVATGEIDESEAKGLPEKLQRHTVGARGFHWSMSVTMFALLITAFFPVIGIQFPWVTIHWIAGVLLILTVIYHIYHVFAKQDFWTMWIDRRDVEEGKLGLKAALGQSDAERPRAGKYPVDQKMFHHVAMIATLGAVVTGILMMFRIDNFLLPMNTYMFSDATWGWIYVIHGVCGIGLIFLVIAHVYFAIRPEKRWMTWSMINGWIDRDRYLENHDPARWTVDGSSQTAEAEGD